uniref:Uncharacterized protein n=1 Tax=Pristionchus pacificus TaxID=54126 RepID=A0A8R1Z1T7_PRIPA
MSGRSHPKYGRTGDRRQSITLVPEGSQNRAAKKDLIGLVCVRRDGARTACLDPSWIPETGILYLDPSWKPLFTWIQLLWCPESTWNQVEMGFQVGIKYSTPAPFPQVGIKEGFYPAASSTHLAYKPYPDCLRARVRLTIRGPQWDRLLDVTFHTWSYHVRPLVTVWGNPCSLSISNRGSYRNSHRFLTIPQVGIKHFPQFAIKLESNLWELLDSKLITDTRVLYLTSGGGTICMPPPGVSGMPCVMVGRWGVGGCGYMPGPGPPTEPGAGDITGEWGTGMPIAAIGED